MPTLAVRVSAVDEVMYSAPLRQVMGFLGANEAKHSAEIIVRAAKETDGGAAREAGEARRHPRQDGRTLVGARCRCWQWH